MLHASADALFLRGWRYSSSSHIPSDLPDAAIDVLMTHFTEAPSPLSKLERQQLGGAIARVPRRQDRARTMRTPCSPACRAMVVAPRGLFRAGIAKGGTTMAVASVSRITAASPESFEAAVREGLARASKTLRGITGLHVIDQKASVTNGKIAEYRVTMDVTFILEG